MHVIEESEVSGNNPDHLEEEARLALDRNTANRLEYIKNSDPWIGYPALQSVLQYMEEIARQPWEKKGKEHLLITSRPGMGLHNIVRRFEEEFHENTPPGAAINYTVVVTSPAYSTRNAFIDCIFNGLNLRDNGIGWGLYSQREKRIKDYMRLFQTRVLIMLDIDNIEENRKKEQKQIITQLRVWSDEWKIALIMTGYRKAAAEIVGLDEGLDSRTTHIRLKEMEKGVFRRFVAQWVKFMPLPNPSPLFSDKRTIDILHENYKSNTLLLIKKIKEAATSAVLRESKTIDYEDLQKSGLLGSLPASGRDGKLIRSPAAEVRESRVRKGDV
jgi:hypothetical protein